MTTTLMIFQAVVSVLLIVIVLLQFGKGAEAGLMSGGGGESLMTGAQQGNILSKATVVLSILFMGNSVLLAKIQSEKAGSSLLDNEAPVARPLNSDAQTETAAPTTAPQAEKKMEEKVKTEEKK
ncbi:MAG: preprotein translocase subunit SecG [Halobacteriovoraceae bacterium]|nr:preprotein translocase subunit SecG [Halobacteriovoraceae bacterium]